MDEIESEARMFQGSVMCYVSGECIQRKFGGHRCDCTGTGFHGQACQVGEQSMTFLHCVFHFSLLCVYTVKLVKLVSRVFSTVF